MTLQIFSICANSKLQEQSKKPLQNYKGILQFGPIPMDTVKRGLAYIVESRNWHFGWSMLPRCITLLRYCLQWYIALSDALISAAGRDIILIVPAKIALSPLHLYAARECGVVHCNLPHEGNSGSADLFHVDDDIDLYRLTTEMLMKLSYFTF